MNNEPVAWMRTNKQWRKEVSWVEKEGFDIPLYTHPAKPIDKPDECLNGCPENQVCDYCAGIKTITDEEIIKTMVQFDVYSADDQCLIEAGRAILRKAQEK